MSEGQSEKPVAITPPIGWRQSRDTWPATPEGYRLVVMSEIQAGAMRARFGVWPAHIAQCTYAIWVLIDGPEFGPDAPIVDAARRWIAEIGAELAAELAGRQWPFGRLRIIQQIEAESGKPWPWSKLRSTDVHDFLDAVEFVLKGTNDAKPTEPADASAESGPQGAETATTDPGSGRERGPAG